MDPQKVVKFIDMASDIDQSMSKEEVLKKLADIPLSVANEYAATLSYHFEDWLLIRNIILAIGHPETFRSLSETLPESLYERLGKVALYLSSKDPLDGVHEIVAATLNTTAPTKESQAKAAEVIKTITSNVDLASKAKKLSAFANNLQLLADAMVVLNMGSEYFELVLDDLSKRPEKDVDDISLIAKSLN